MSTREERILEVIRARMAAITGEPRVEIDPVDEHEDTGPYPAIGIIPGSAEARTSQIRQQLVMTLPITLRGITQAEPAEAGEGDVPVSARTSAYALWAQMLAALFPVPDPVYGSVDDRLDGQAIAMTYRAHEVFPRADGTHTYGVYLEVDVEYSLHLDNPAG